MGVCWHCYWGFSAKVQAIYERAEIVAGYDNMHYGPAHAVWDDQNMDKVSIQMCLDSFDKYWRRESFAYSEYSEEKQKNAVRQSLLALLELPDDVLDPCPANYDDKHPENFPPSVPMANPR